MRRCRRSTCITAIVTEIHFRIVRQDWAERMKRGSDRPEWMEQNERKSLLGMKPELEWSEKLPATDDFRERVEQLPAPKDLKPGYYFLIASHDKGFTDRNNVVSFSDIWVSDLALVMRWHYGDAKLGGFVLDARSGDPIQGANVQFWPRNNQGKYFAGEKTTTDANGASPASRG